MMTTTPDRADEGYIDPVTTVLRTGSWGDLVSVIDPKPKDRAERLLQERVVAKFVPLLSSLEIEFIIERESYTPKEAATMDVPFRMCRGGLAFGHEVMATEAPDELARGFLELVRKEKDRGGCQICTQPQLKILHWDERFVSIGICAWIRACR